MEKQRTIVGVIGRNGAGKDELSKRLHARCGLPMLSAGDIARRIAKERGVEPTRPGFGGSPRSCSSGREEARSSIARSGRSSGPI